MGSPIALNAKFQGENKSVIQISENAILPVHKSITIGLNKSVIIELPTDIRDVVVSSPKILDAVVQTSKRSFLIGLATGQANAFFFDKSGNKVLTLEVKVERDLTPLLEMMQRYIPGSRIEAEMVNDNIILNGRVRSPADAVRASSLAARFVEKKEKVLNMIEVAAKEQVLLKVTIAEMNRDSIKRLGVNWNGGGVGNVGGSNFGTNNGFPLTNANGSGSFLTGVFGPNPASCTLPGTNVTLNPAVSFASAFSCFAATMEAFERTGLLRTLAEPNLTAISGETAKFLAGGEFPVPVSQDDGQVSVEFKPFGVGLSFTPVVLSENNISLKISTEVSELSTEGAVQLSQISLPSLRVRRAETMVELPSGGALVIAGLLSDETQNNFDGVPGLKKVPVLGSLFRSKDFRKRETELVVIVTPYMVRARSPQDLEQPNRNFAPATDRKANFLGHINKVYGNNDDVVPKGNYKGNYGFIVD
ncbi:MAG: type II and III secretion system protein family protein [Pseudomonadota bacterium]